MSRMKREVHILKDDAESLEEPTEELSNVETEEPSNVETNGSRCFVTLDFHNAETKRETTLKFQLDTDRRATCSPNKDLSIGKQDETPPN